MATITQAEFNTMLQTAIAAGLPGGYYTSRWSGEELDNLAAAGNTNLLDNWYFPDPINQRGQTQYTAAGYTIDRWGKPYSSGSVSITSDGVLVAGSDSTYCDIQQFIEDYSELFGKTVCLSVLTDNKLYSITATIPKAPGDTITSLNYTATDNGGIWIRVSSQQLLIQLRGNTKTSQLYKAAKLELGPVSTLAHQEADGNWVLNDPPPNKALELAKCQRYYNVLTPNAYLNTSGFSGLYELCLQYPSMRINPAVTLHGSNNITADLISTSSCLVRSNVAGAYISSITLDANL